jgi:hypothetical protein
MDMESDRRPEDKVSRASSRSWLRESGKKLPEEEMAADFAVSREEAPAVDRETDDDRKRRRALAEVRSAGRSLGWTAIVLAVAALFLWPILLGLTAAVLGFAAFRQGARSLGVWAMTLGLIAAVAYFLITPLRAIVT